MRLGGLLYDICLGRVGREGYSGHVVNAAGRIVHPLLVTTVLHLDVWLHISSGTRWKQNVVTFRHGCELCKENNSENVYLK